MKIDYEPILEKFLIRLKKLSEITGVMYFGSTASKTWDKYSDLDIDIIVKDKNYKKFLEKIPKLLKYLEKLN